MTLESTHKIGKHSGAKEHDPRVSHEPMVEPLVNGLFRPRVSIL
jgi:hypothetical protein